LGEQNPGVVLLPQNPRSLSPSSSPQLMGGVAMAAVAAGAIEDELHQSKFGRPPLLLLFLSPSIVYTTRVPIG